MKCETAQRLLVGMRSESAQEAEELVAHVRTCRDCAELLKFDQRLEDLLSLPTEEPPHLLTRIRQEIAEQPRLKSWIRPDRRSQFMQRFTLAAASTAIVTIVLTSGLTRSAKAADAKAQFNSIKTAVLSLAAAKGRPQLFQTSGQQIRQTEKLYGWTVEDGNMIEVRTLPKLYGAPTEERTPLERQIAKNQDAARQQLERAEREVAIAQKMKIDLDAQTYQSIAFGKAANTIVLVPKTKTDQRYVVAYDPKSNIPRTVRLERVKGGQWTLQRKSSVIFNPDDFHLVRTLPRSN